MWPSTETLIRQLCVFYSCVNRTAALPQSRPAGVCLLASEVHMCKCWFVCVLVCVNTMCVCVLCVSYHEQLQQQHQQKQQALGRWEFWVVVMARPPPVPLSAEVSLRPPPMASSPPRSAGIGPVYCRDRERERDTVMSPELLEEEVF